LQLEIILVILSVHSRLKRYYLPLQVMPTDHSHTVCTFHEADAEIAKRAVAAALDAKSKWETLPFEDKAAIFLKVPDIHPVAFITQLSYKEKAIIHILRSNTKPLVHAHRPQICCRASTALMCSLL